MAIEWLAVWGVGNLVFRPILEDLATDVAKDAANSYVGKCFQSVFSVIHKEPLSKATGLAVKELLELIESELIRAEIPDEELPDWVEDVRRFTTQDAVRQTIASLLLEPDHHLDPKTFVTAWQQMEGAHSVPESEGFKWEYIARQFARRVVEIRNSSSELRETFDSLANDQDSTAMKELAGLPPDFNLDTYREALVERYGNLDFASLETTGAYYSSVRLWRVFVPQSVRECHEYDPQLLEVPKEHLERLAAAGELDGEQLAESENLHEERRQAYVNQPARPVLDVSDDPSIQRMVILGDPGSGKSCLLQFLALRWARINDANQRYTQPLPLLIELREYNRWECSNGKSFSKYLHEAQTWHRLNQHTLKHLLEQSDRVVLLLDGLDEVFDPAERELVINDIHRFSNDHKQVRIVVTSRVVGYKPKRLRDAEFRHFMLQDLDKEQIGHFLDKWHEVTFDKAEEARPKQERLARAIETSKSIGQLAGNPLLLTMMAILNRNQKLPDDRVDLYQQCSRVLLHQWDVEGKLLEEFPGLSAEIGLREKQDILRSVAYAMQTRITDKSRANFIDGETLESLIEDYLHDELHFEQAKALARALVEQLRARNFILCYLGADSYAFVHRTFLEYFCAADIVHHFNVAKTLSEQDLIALFDAHCRDDDWREVLRLICGQIDEQFVGRIVEHLAMRTDLEKWVGEHSLAEIPLAISCLGEVRNRMSIRRESDRLLAECVKIFSTSVDSFAHRPDGAEFMDQCCEELVVAARALGGDWPHIDSLAFDLEWSDEGHTYLEGLWLQFFAAATNDRQSIERALEHDREFVREGAYKAAMENWPDSEMGRLICERARKDPVAQNRRTAVEALAENLRNETTYKFLWARASEDPHFAARYRAIQLLGKWWPANHSDVLARKAVDSSLPAQQRREHCLALCDTHSVFAMMLFSANADGNGASVDPLEPIARHLIEHVAVTAGVGVEHIDSVVASLSAHLGWDITKGASSATETC